MVGEVGFAAHEQAGDGAHQVVVHPEAAHGVVDGGVDPHRRLVRVFAGDAVVHVEEVAVALTDRGLAQAPGRVREVQIDSQAARPDAATGVAGFLGRPRRNVTRGEVAVRRILPLQVVVAVRLGDRVRRASDRRRSSAPRRGHRYGATRSSGSAWTGTRRQRGYRSDGSGCSTGWRTLRPCGAPARSPWCCTPSHMVER